MRPLIEASIINQEYEENINVTLKRSRHSDLNNVIFSYLNISSVRNRVGDLDKIVDGNIDIVYIAKTKSDESFPNNQFVHQYNQTDDNIYWILQTAKVA